MRIRTRAKGLWPISSILHELSVSPSDNDERAERIYNEGKKLSDFVGMIVRLAFTLFAFQYFSAKAAEVDGLIAFVYGLCTVSAFGLTAALAGKIFRIIYFWEVRDVVNAPSRYMKLLFLIFALSSTAITYFGLFIMARDIASASPLLSGS